MTTATMSGEELLDLRAELRAERWGEPCEEQARCADCKWMVLMVEGVRGGGEPTSLGERAAPLCVEPGEWPRLVEDVRQDACEWFRPR